MRAPHQIRSVAEYLIRSAQRFPDKAAYVDETRSITFGQLRREAFLVASALLRSEYHKQPVVVFLDKSCACVSSFLGVACSGNFYSPVDIHMPTQRIKKIMDTLHPRAIITDLENKAQAEEFACGAEILLFENILNETAREDAVLTAIGQTLDTDVLYVLFTSGSTGTPKGVIIPHRGVVDFMEWNAECYGYDENIIVANQSPLYFSVSVFDIYQTLRNGGTTHLISPQMYAFPALLMRYMFDNHINMLNCVPSALSMVAALNALKEPFLPELKIVLFGGESISMRHLNKWREAYPDVMFINQYGPTEVTDTCTYYVLDRPFAETDTLPIGHPCKNMEVFLLDDDGKPVPDGEIGEIYVRGTGLAYGYYNDPEKTAMNFVQNPMHDHYPEIVYRTGDLARRNDRGELVFAGRKDFQIKHRGHRIELGEIETMTATIDRVKSCACQYDVKKARIVLFYVGAIDPVEIIARLKTLLPEYMVPGKATRLEEMPLNPNGKIDRQRLKDMMER